MVDDGQRNFVDIASIPFAAVERIEVVLDGASAIYGSDAIAGVVNIILKKSYKGFGITANAGTTQHGGGNTVYASAVGGFQLDGGHYGFVAAEYRHQDQITLSQRSGKSWTNFDWTGQGGQNVSPGAKSANNTNPFIQTPVLQRAGGNITSLPTTSSWIRIARSP